MADRPPPPPFNRAGSGKKEINKGDQPAKKGMMKSPSPLYKSHYHLIVQTF